MNPVLNQCPVCKSDLIITRLECRDCGTTIDGSFFTSAFTQLSQEQLIFVETFIRCEGKLNRMESELDLSYPTIRNRLLEVIKALGYEPGAEEPVRLSNAERQRILEDLNQGKISAEEAMQLLQEK